MQVIWVNLLVLETEWMHKYYCS